MEKNGCITINCGCCNGAEASGGNPVGTIISYIGFKAPNNYLICDGSELNIYEYPRLSEHIREEFGSSNYFGGDGINFFAVPDLRNEFLRGFYVDKEEKLSGDIGIHQNSTDHILLDKRPQTQENGVLQIATLRDNVLPENIDKMALKTTNDDNVFLSQFTPTSAEISSGNSSVGCFYNSRPTNVAVLYCIKF